MVMRLVSLSLAALAEAAKSALRKIWVWNKLNLSDKCEGNYSCPFYTKKYDCEWDFAVVRRHDIFNS